jgi:hypothetical protein
MFLFSCNSSKHSIFSASLAKDSTKLSTTIELKKDDYRAHHITTKDTAVVFPYKSILARFSPEQLQPLYNAQGKPQKQIHIIDTNGLKAIVTAMLDGSVSVSCEADSLKIVIAAVTRINDSLIKNSIHSTDISVLQTKEERITYAEFFKKTGTWFGRNWITLCVIVGAVLTIEIIYRKFKSK